MTVCIYHGNCADGFGAAWVVRKAIGEIEFHPGTYGQPPPDVTGKDVVMVDFSYKPEVRASSSNNVRRAAIVARFFPPILAPKVADLMAQQQSGESAYLQQR